MAAKGADWFIALARNSPNLQFICPFPRARSIVDPPANLTFRLMTWEAGLREAMAASRMVMVPSLWSAPIEGALIKSLITNDRVAILDNDSAFQSELPHEAVLRLSGDPKQAARQLQVALDGDWAPDAVVHRDWLRDFRKFNERFFENISDVIFDDRSLAAQSFNGKEAVEA